MAQHSDPAIDTLASYLRARRLGADPLALGVPMRPGRRIAGLRREELADLAGISVGYYKRLEQGSNTSPSRQVVAALARTLSLEPTDAAHLFRLAGHAPARSDAASAEGVSRLEALVGSLEMHAAVLIGPSRDVIAATALAVALDPAFTPGNNMLEQHFLNPQVRARLRPWKRIALAAAAAARATLAEHDVDEGLRAVVETLLVRSPEFAAAWNDRRVGPMYDGAVTVLHPDLGELDLCVTRLRTDAVPGYAVMLFHAQPGTSGYEGLVRLSRDTMRTCNVQGTRNELRDE